MQPHLQEGFPDHHIYGMKQSDCGQIASHGKSQHESPGSHSCLYSLLKEPWKSPVIHVLFP